MGLATVVGDDHTIDIGFEKPHQHVGLGFGKRVGERVFH
jgi:hypothetical protein